MGQPEWLFLWDDIGPVDLKSAVARRIVVGQDVRPPGEYADCAQGDIGDVKG